MDDETARARADVERAREEFGEAASALAREVDPRVRAQRVADDAKRDVRARVDQALELAREDPRRTAAVAGAVVGVLLWRRRRRRRRR